MIDFANRARETPKWFGTGVPKGRLFGAAASWRLVIPQRSSFRLIGTFSLPAAVS